jgi:anti-sigma factor RsiW
MEKLLLYAHQMLEPSEELSVRAHLAGCPRCRETVESYEDLSAVLDEWKAPESSPWFDARVRAAIAASEPRAAILNRWSFNLRRWPAVLGMAAISVLAVCAMLLVNHGSRTQQTPARRPSSLTAQRGSRITRAGEQDTSTQVAHQASSEHSGIGTEEPNAAESTQAEDDEMLSSFDVLSELPKPQNKQMNN